MTIQSRNLRAISMLLTIFAVPLTGCGSSKQQSSQVKDETDNWITLPSLVSPSDIPPGVMISVTDKFGDLSVPGGADMLSVQYPPISTSPKASLVCHIFLDMAFYERSLQLTDFYSVLGARTEQVKGLWGLMERTAVVIDMKKSAAASDVEINKISCLLASGITTRDGDAYSAQSFRLPTMNEFSCLFNAMIKAPEGRTNPPLNCPL